MRRYLVTLQTGSLIETITVHAPTRKEALARAVDRAPKGCVVIGCQRATE